MVTHVSPPLVLSQPFSKVVLIVNLHHGTVKTLGSRRKTLGRASPTLLQCRDFPDIPIDTHEGSVLRICSPVPVRVRVSNFWKFSGFVAGFVVTVLCLSRRTVLHTLHARILSALIEFCTSHLK